MFPSAYTCGEAAGLRENQRPTCEQIFRLFSQSERHALKYGQDTVKIFNPALAPLQRQVLALLGISSSAYEHWPEFGLENS